MHVSAGSLLLKLFGTRLSRSKFISWQMALPLFSPVAFLKSVGLIWFFVSSALFLSAENSWVVRINYAMCSLSLLKTCMQLQNKNELGCKKDKEQRSTHPISLSAARQSARLCIYRDAGRRYAICCLQHSTHLISETSSLFCSGTLIPPIYQQIF